MRTFALPEDKLKENRTEIIIACRDYEIAKKRGDREAELEALNRAYEFMWRNYMIYQQARREAFENTRTSDLVIEIDEQEFFRNLRELYLRLDTFARLSFHLRWRKAR